MTVGELRSRMSQREFVEWGAYYRIKAEREAHQRQRQRNASARRGR
jgi:hypothetical protein